jgi:thiaminase (transcriptional activator TenA)
MSTHATLWAANAELVNRILQHPFVRGLADGSLPRPAFEGFILQDAYFLDAFARAYALALARSPDRQSALEFFDLLAGTLDELRTHSMYAASWGIPFTDVKPADATLEYTEFLLATAALRTLGETCAAMTPCMRLYAFLGQSLAAEGADKDGKQYAAWVRTYAASEFEALAARLEGLLDRHAVDSEGLRSTYRRALSLELAFFESAWRL